MILSIYIDDIMDKDDAKEVAEYFGVIPENSEGKIAMCFQDVNEKKLSMMDLEKIKVFAEKFEWVPIDDLEEFLNKYKL